jgi:hypothetical protein
MNCTTFSALSLDACFHLWVHIIFEQGRGTSWLKLAELAVGGNHVLW